MELPEFLDGVDMLEGLRNMDDNPVLYRRVLVNMARRCRGFMDRLALETNKGDGVEIARMFHTLKGLAGTVGAKELKDRSAAMEIVFGKSGEGVLGRDESLLDFRLALERIVVSLSVLDEESGKKTGGEL